jgi:hypothetical protein
VPKNDTKKWLKSYEERAQFVLRFVETDLEALRPGVWRGLREEFIAFAGIPSLQHKDCTPEILDIQQIETRTVLMTIASQNRERSARTQTWSWGQINVGWTFQAGDFHPTLPIGDQLVGDPRQLFRWAMFVTLSKVDVSRVRLCAEQCVQEATFARSRLFWAQHGRQWYCSQRCMNRAKLRRYRHKA